jgi:hypothetical protein
LGVPSLAIKPQSKLGRTCFTRLAGVRPRSRAPRDSKESFALIPAVRVVGDPEGTQGLSRVLQTAFVEILRKSVEAAMPGAAWAAEVSLSPEGLIGGSVVAIG